jgi:hypothetical protein
MRLSRSATTPQYVDLYVLADHRMDQAAHSRPAGALASAVVVVVVVLARRARNVSA